jgi:hypothetical protein
MGTEDFASTFVMVPLQKKLFFVCKRAAFDQILKLGEIICQGSASAHWVGKSLRPGPCSLSVKRLLGAGSTGFASVCLEYGLSDGLRNYNTYYHWASVR